MVIRAAVMPRAHLVRTIGLFGSNSQIDGPGYGPRKGDFTVIVGLCHNHRRPARFLLDQQCLNPARPAVFAFETGQPASAIRRRQTRQSRQLGVFRNRRRRNPSRQTMAKQPIHRQHAGQHETTE